MDVLGNDRREGLGRKSETRAGLLLFIFVSIFLLFSSLYSADASVFRKAREGAIEAASPILRAFAGPADYLQDRIGEVRHYFFVLEQNKALREQIEDLRYWEREARDLRQLMASYEALSAYKPFSTEPPVNAFVFGESNNVFNRSMMVDAGRNDGVERGQAVLDGRGLVGRIVEASDNAARVLLLTDAQSRIPVFVEGSEVEGMLAGKSSREPSITFTRFDDLNTIEIGQRVTTSGSEGQLPPGLPIGVIAEVRAEEAVVDLDANYLTTRMVQVVRFSPPQLDETAAGDDASGPLIADSGAADEDVRQ